MITLVYSVPVICALLAHGRLHESAVQGGTTPEVTVRIHNYAAADPSLVHHAERVADNILRGAAVTAAWVDCPLDQQSSYDSTCDKPFSSLDFLVNLIPRSMSDRLHLKSGTLGLAIEGDRGGFGHVAFIFDDAVRDCAAQQSQDLDVLLGAAIAHELGHLLLGTNSHSALGLMSAFWSRNQLVVVQRSGLAFSPADSVRVREALRVRGRVLLTAAETSTPDHHQRQFP